ncbi:hypothetical protein GCM10010254_29360 [Streptomyces chromofuscus]|nr:hypothetical protein GCM10010254_29360 [Streptomyces chromofuscus]
MGAPRARLRVLSPQAERTQTSGDAADKLVLFAKLYDVAPDGTQTGPPAGRAGPGAGRAQAVHGDAADDRAPPRAGAPAAIPDRRQ